MKALQKYKNSKHPEAGRRVAQSLGYRMSIYDLPHMIALMQRAGIELAEPPVNTEKQILADTETLAL